MKPLKPIAFFGIIILLLNFSFGCKKDKNVEPSGLLRDYMIRLKSDTFSVVYYPSIAVEEGYSFSPKVDGYITSLGVKMLTAGEYRIKVSGGGWNEYRMVIANVVVDLPISNKWVYTTIPPLELKAGVKYFISVYIPEMSYLYISHPLTFPFETSNISIINNVRIYYGTINNYLVGVNGDGIPIDKIYGMPDFVFTPK